MKTKIKIKYHLLIFLSAFIIAIGACFLLNNYFSGPRLGAHYDFLLSFRQPPPVSTEILLIDTNDYIENNDIFSVLLALTEMEAGALVMTGHLSPLSSPVTVTEQEVRRRFMDEYSIIGSNIRNLFEAIRMGSVSPVNAPEYVDKLVELTDHGKDRLLAALIDRDEDFLLSINVFGNYMEAADSQNKDKDGKLRRVQPVNMETFEEHPVYSFIKPRYAVAQIETIEEKKILWLKSSYSQFNEDDEESHETDIPLDNNANIITPWNCSYRSIDIDLFKQYEEAQRKIRIALEEADMRGAYSKTLPERSPLFLGDYALMAREDMLKSPTKENIRIWKTARKEYFKSMDEFLSGNAEELLVAGYNEVIADEEDLTPEGLAALAGMRDGLTVFFVYLREEYDNLKNIRLELENNLNAAFCIMGTPANTAYSALLANVLITKSHIKPVSEKEVMLWSFLAVFIILAAVFWLRPIVQIIAGLTFCLLSAITFSCIFIYTSYWIDPLISLGSGSLGVLVIYSLNSAFITHKKNLFITAYGASVSSDVLKTLIKEGKPYPGETVQANIAVIAVRDTNLLSREDREKPQDAGKLRKSYFNAVKEVVFNAGGIIAGYEGDTVLVCFGSPFDKTVHPVSKACSFVKKLLSDKNNTWRFGLDTGVCSFYWSQETSFSVHGRSAVRARMLASRTIRLKVRALITENVKNKMKLDIEKIDSLYEDSEPIFEL